MEGQGDLVGGLIMGITRVTMWVIGGYEPTYQVSLTLQVGFGSLEVIVAISSSLFFKCGTRQNESWGTPRAWGCSWFRDWDRRCEVEGVDTQNPAAV